MKTFFKSRIKRWAIPVLFLLGIPFLMLSFLAANFRETTSPQTMLSANATTATVTLTIENGISGSIRQIVLDAGTSINDSPQINVIDAVYAGHFFNGWRVPSIAPFPLTTFEINNRVWNVDTTITATWGVLNPRVLRFEDGFGAPTSARTISSGQSINTTYNVAKIAEPVYPGHTFVGWKSDLWEDTRTSAQVEAMHFSSGIAIKASWTINNPIALVFRNDAGQTLHQTTLARGHTINTSYGASVLPVTRAGHTFAGYRPNWQSNVINLELLSRTSFGTDTIVGTSWTINNPTPITMHFSSGHPAGTTETQRTIFAAQGFSINQTYNNWLNDSDLALRREGHAFLGWTSPSWVGIRSSAQISDMVIRNPLEITASWIATHSATITIEDGLGNPIVGASRTVATGQSVNSSFGVSEFTTPTLDGHRFVGWASALWDDEDKVWVEDHLWTGTILTPALNNQPFERDSHVFAVWEIREDEDILLTFNTLIRDGDRKLETGTHGTRTIAADTSINTTYAVGTMTNPNIAFMVDILNNPLLENHFFAGWKIGDPEDDDNVELFTTENIQSVVFVEDTIITAIFSSQAISAVSFFSGLRGNVRHTTQFVATGASINTTVENIGEELIGGPLIDPELIGHEFLGWVVPGRPGELISTANVKTIPFWTNTNIVASWELKFPLTITFMGGHDGKTEYTTRDVALDQSITTSYNTLVVLPPAVGVPGHAAGHTFAGWKLPGQGGLLTTADINNRVFDNHETITASWTFTNTTILTFMTGVNENIFYDSIDIATGQSADTSYKGEKISDPELRGHTFRGWRVPGIPTLLSSDEINARPFNFDIQIFAEWNLYKPQTITFLTGVDRDITHTTRTIAAGESIASSYEVTNITEPTLPGHRFAGWRINGIGQPFSTPEINTREFAEFEFENEELDVIATWQRLNPTELTFYTGPNRNTPWIDGHTNTGTGHIREIAGGQSIRTSYEVRDIVEPTLVGHRFIGWESTQWPGVRLTTEQLNLREFTADARIEAAYEIVTEIHLDFRIGLLGITPFTERTIAQGLSIFNSFDVANLTIPPILAGHDFAGWTNHELWGASGRRTNDQVNIHDFLEDTTLVATWTITDAQTLRFEDGFGNLEFNRTAANTLSIVRTYKGVLAVDAADRTGHTFKGWQVNGVGDILSTTQINERPFTNGATIYAVWEIDNPTLITFNTGLQRNVPFQTRIVAEGHSIADSYAIPDIFPPVDLAGHTFAGWRSSAWEGILSSAQVNQRPFHVETTINATWNLNNQTTLTFNPQGGNWSGATANRTALVADGQSINTSYNGALILAPTRIGHSFAGWESTAWDNLLSSDSVNTRPFDGGRTITINARWTILSPVDIILHDGFGGNYPTRVAAGGYSINQTFETIAVPQPTRRGHFFSHWIVEGSAKDRYTTDELNTRPFYSDTNVYASWTFQTTIGLTFVLETVTAGVLAPYTTRSIAGSESIVTSYKVLDIVDPTGEQVPPGHSFLGWRSARWVGEKTTEEVNNFQFHDDTQVRAVWKIENPQGLRFETANVNGGTTWFADRTVARGQSIATTWNTANITTPNAPVGHDFDGWTSSLWSGRQTTEWVNNRTFNTDMTIVAEWKLQAPINVTFMLANVTGGPATFYHSRTIGTGLSIILSFEAEEIVDPTGEQVPPGHTFAGWKSEAWSNTLTSEQVNGTTFNSPITITASWNHINPKTLTFVLPTGDAAITTHHATRIISANFSIRNSYEANDVPPPSIPHYRFEHWVVQGTTTPIPNINLYDEFDDNTTLEAVFSIQAASLRVLTFDLANVTGGQSHDFETRNIVTNQSINQTIGTVGIVDPTGSFIPPGHTFRGWKHPTLWDGVMSSEGVNARGFIDSTTITASWNLVEARTLTFLLPRGDGGTEQYDTRRIASGHSIRYSYEAADLLPPSIESYIFEHWVVEGTTTPIPNINTETYTDNTRFVAVFRIHPDHRRTLTFELADVQGVADIPFDTRDIANRMSINQTIGTVGITDPAPGQIPPGHRFIGWESPAWTGPLTSTVLNGRELTISGDITVTGIWEIITPVILTFVIPAVDGTETSFTRTIASGVSILNSYLATSVGNPAAPNAGHTFTGWKDSISGDVISTDINLFTPFDSDRTLTANFVLNDPINLRFRYIDLVSTDHPTGRLVDWGTSDRTVASGQSIRTTLGAADVPNPPTPPAGHTFNHWRIEGTTDNVPDINMETFRIAQGATITLIAVYRHTGTTNLNFVLPQADGSTSNWDLTRAVATGQSLNTSLNNLTGRQISTPITSDPPAPAGHRFDGWSANGKTLTMAQLNAEPFSGATATITAIFLPLDARTLTLEPNGGNAIANPTRVIQNGMSIANTVGASAVTDPTRTGVRFSFAGWNVHGATSPASNVLLPSTTLNTTNITANAGSTLTARARWNITVTFDPAQGSFNGTNATTDRMSLDGGTLNGTGQGIDTPPIRAGHRFLGWRDSHTTNLMTNAAVMDLVINDVRTFTAVWEVAITVAFDPNRGVFQGVETTTVRNVHSGGSLANSLHNGVVGAGVLSGVPTRDNFHFRGWSTNMNDNPLNTHLSIETLNTRGHTTNTIYYAIWQGFGNNTIDLNGGTGFPGTINIVPGQTLTQSNPGMTAQQLFQNVLGLPTRPGFFFVGWRIVGCGFADLVYRQFSGSANTGIVGANLMEHRFTGPASFSAVWVPTAQVTRLSNVPIGSTINIPADSFLVAASNTNGLNHTSVVQTTHTAHNYRSSGHWIVLSSSLNGNLLIGCANQSNASSGPRRIPQANGSTTIITTTFSANDIAFFPVDAMEGWRPHTAF